MVSVPDASEFSPVFHLPEDLHYECTCDGTCCNGWDILAQPDEVARIEALDWRSCSGLGAKVKSPFEVSWRDRNDTILRRIGPACNFLGKDNRCALHARFGEDVKPGACWRFPYRFVDGPDGFYVGLSFVCRSVRKNMGPLVTEQFDEVRDRFVAQPSYHRLDDPTRFDSETPLEWGDYQAIERGLDEILAREDQPVGRCLVAGHAWLGVLSQMLKASALVPGGNVGEVVRFYCERTRGEGYARAFAIAGRSVGSRVLKRMLLGSFISFHSSLLRRRSRLLVIASVVVQNFRHWFRLGSLRLLPFEQRFSYSAFGDGARELESGEMQELLRRYFRHALFRKDIVRHTDVLRGYCYMVLTYGLIEWYAAALRAAGEADITQSVGLVERYYVNHTDFNQIFLYHPALAEMVQHVFRKPNFAHSIITK